MLKTAKKYAGAVLLAAILMPLFASAATKQFTYTGWLPFWKKTEGAQDISLQLEHLQELSPFSYEVGANGKLVDKLKVHNGFWPDWLAAVKDMHIKIVPTLAWFDGPAIHSLLSNKKKRIAHEDAVTKLVKDEKYDGIDIDYESKLAETAPYFSLFIEGL